MARRRFDEFLPTGLAGARFADRRAISGRNTAFTHARVINATTCLDLVDAKRTMLAVDKDEIQVELSQNVDHPGGREGKVVAVSLAAGPHLLLRLAQAGQKAVASPLTFARLVRLNLMHRRPLDQLLDPELQPLANPLK